MTASDATDELAQVSYQKMYDAYARIFQRCGLKALPVEADTGIMGGKFSHEFMVPAETGENEVVYWHDSGAYAANVEKGHHCRGPLTPTPQVPVSGDTEKFATPGIVTIDASGWPRHLTTSRRTNRSRRWSISWRTNPSSFSSAVTIN